MLDRFLLLSGMIMFPFAMNGQTLTHLLLPDDNNCQAIHHDPVSNTLWVTAGNNVGVLYRQNGNTWDMFDSSDGDLPAFRMESLATDSQGDLWIGNKAAGLTRYDGATFTTFTQSNSGLASDAILDVAIDPEDRVWLGLGNGAGLARYDQPLWLANGDWPDPDLFGKNVAGLAIDRLDPTRIWLACFDGLRLLSTDTILHWTLWEQGMPDDHLSGVAQESNGRIWMSLYNGGSTGYGLASFFQGQWISYTESNSDIPDDIVYDVFVDSQDRVWAATQSGIGLLDNGSWTVWNNTNSDLVTNIIRDFTEDAAGNIWATTNYGLARIDGLTDLENYFWSPSWMTLDQNPVRQEISLTLDGSISSQVYLVDIRGQVLNAWTLAPGSHRLSCQGRASGVYWLMSPGRPPISVVIHP